MYNITFEKNAARVDGIKDFDIGQTFDCGQCFRFEQSGNGWQGVQRGSWARFEQPSPDTLLIYGADESNINGWLHFLALDADYAAVKRELAEKFGGETIKNAMEYGGGIRILRQEPWETVCSFIISQNNNIPRIKKIIAVMSESFGKPFEANGEKYYAFPTADALYEAGEDKIFALKTGFRAKYIYDAAARVCDGRLALDALENAGADELTNALTQVCGIGPKVAACASLYGFGHTEAFPIDVWIKRVLAKYYPQGLDIASLGQYAGIAQQYLFYYERGHCADAAGKTKTNADRI